MSMSSGQLAQLGERWQAGEKIARLAREVGLSWNKLHVELTRLGYSRGVRLPKAIGVEHQATVRGLKDATDTVSCLAMADLLEEEGAPELEVRRWRLYGAWLEAFTQVIKAEPWFFGPARRPISAARRWQRRFLVELRDGDQDVEGAVLFNPRTIDARVVDGYFYRTKGLSRRKLEGASWNGYRSPGALDTNSGYLRDKVRWLVDEYLKDWSARQSQPDRAA
jgi:hypothetical protein